MSWLLDTNVVSELRKARAGSAVDAAFKEWAESRPVGLDFLSAITIYELELGIGQVMRRDHHQAQALQQWLETQVLADFSGRILDLTRTVLSRAASLQVHRTRQERDTFIAATALTHNLGIVTRNLRDFDGTGVHLLNPWQL